MKTLVTGAAGFIGFSLVRTLLRKGFDVIGIDNHNDYYDVGLKESRVEQNQAHRNYQHVKGDISDWTCIREVFSEHSPSVVVNLAAQAGVRYSLENPSAYVSANIVGFSNVLEASRMWEVQNLVYASSSSVYGANSSMPFSTHASADHPMSLYAATKRANELMAHSYSHLFGLPTTGLRFFTVYGPWGRPDMALFKFTQAILSGEPIDIYNHGRHRRDFTYIDDIVAGLVRILDKPAEPRKDWDSSSPDPATSSAPWRIYNMGNSRPVLLLDYIEAIEKALDRKARRNLLPIQAGDLPDTFADVDDLVADFNYKPETSVDDGVSRFVEWYRAYYKV